MSDIFLNATTGGGGQVSYTYLNTWFNTLGATPLATPNKLCLRNATGGASFGDVSANRIIINASGNQEPLINLKDATGNTGYEIKTDLNRNVPNLYILNSNNSGHTHLQAKSNVVIETTGNSSGTILFNSQLITTSGRLVVNAPNATTQAQFGTSLDTFSITALSGNSLSVYANLSSATNFNFGINTNDITSNFNLITGSLVRMFVNNSGNIGIGTTNPLSKLDIIGNTTISGRLNVENYVSENNKPFWGYWSNTIREGPLVLTYESVSASGSNFKNISGTPNTDGRANITISGYYDVSFDAWVSDPVSVGGYTDVYIRLNGGNMDQFRSYFTSAVGNYPGCIVMRGIKYFKAGDYLDVNLANGKLHSQGQRFTGVFIGT